MGQRLACVISEEEPQPICVPTRNFKPWKPQTTNKEDERTIIGRETLRSRTVNQQVSHKVTWGDLKGIVQQGTILAPHPMCALFQER